MFGSYSLHICFVYPIQEKILFCWIDSLDGFSLASEQKIIYFPFYQRKNNTLPDGRKSLPFPRAFSRSSHQQFKRKIFYYGLKKNIYEITHSKLMGGLKLLCSTFPLSSHQTSSFYNLLSEWVIIYRRIHLRRSSIQVKLEEIQYQPLEQSDVKELIHDVLNEVQSRENRGINFLFL